MAWLIACFSDLTVSTVSEKWVKKNGRKCYFPKTKVAMKIKKEAVVDKKSEKWGLHTCRILMHGKKFATLEEARQAEKIAQNHSTMTSFEESFVEKRKSRKHPNIFNVVSASESECDDFKNIEKLKKLDSKSSTPTSEKEYTFKRSDDENDDATNQSSEPNSNDDTEGEDVDINDNSGEPSCEASNNSEDDFNLLNNDAFEGQGNENNFLPDGASNLESTSELRSPAAAYDFTDDRCFVRIEKLIMYACQELESIKNEIKALKTKSSETEQVVDKLVSVCKDLSVEVFSCTEELKKRNGMFTDMLIPDLKLPVLRRKHYKNNELALKKIKVTDNMIKYLASTINERKEKSFIRSCFNAIFDTEFLTNKVWWKSEPGKVLIKKSQILYCMKESFLLKFGLVEPKKTDKEVEKLIYDTCRNIKDSYRKSIKKAADGAAKAAEEATKVAEEAAEEAAKAAEKAARKGKKAELREITLTEVDDVDHHNENDWNYEDHENYKKHKKAKKAARKAEELNRTAEKANRAVDEAKRGEDMEDIPMAKHIRKRLATGDEFESNIVAKKHKKKH